MDLFKILGKIAVDNSEAKKALAETSSAAKDTSEHLDDLGNEGQKSSGKLGKFFSACGKGAVTLAKWTVAGIGAASAAIGGVTIKALNAAGELEQNMGGAESVFKELGASIGEMQTKIITGYDESTGEAIYAISNLEEVSKNAFKNMGLSQSDYLATTNKMGALFQGAGFDTQTALDMSSQAMQRAADVASIMGIDTASAMEAVAGAAKGNFTMMDNLGVAMNDTTLQAYALEKGIKKSTSEMTNQEKIGLAMELFMEKTAYAAGNYAKENETLAGSLGTAKAAFTNFLSGAGTVEDVASSFSNLANVVVKNVDEMFPKLMTGFTQIVEKLVPMIPPLLQKVLPGLIEGATGLINGLVAALPAVMDAILAAAPALIEGVTQILNTLIEALPVLVQSLVNALPSLMPSLLNGIMALIISLVSNFSQIIMPIIGYLPQLIIQIVEALMQNLPALIDGIITLVMGIVQALPQIIQALVDALPIVIEMIIKGLLNLIPQLIQGFTQLFGSANKAWEQIKTSLNQIIPNTFKGIWNGIKNVFAPLGGWFKNKFSEGAENAKKAWSAIKNFFSDIWKGIKNTFASVGKWFGDQFRQGKENAQKAWSTVKNFFSNIWSGIKNVFSSIGSWFSSKFTAAKNGVQNAWSGVKNFFSNIKNGIVNTFSNVKEKLTAPFIKARDAIKGVADKIKGFFKGNISMPKIKTPHFSVSPSGWEIGDLLKGKIPKLGIKWYATAMENPIVMTKPTIFGYNAETGELQGGGDAGSEVVSGTNTLMTMIQNAVAAQNNGITYYLQKIVEILASYFPQILEAMAAEKGLTVDELVRMLAKPMNVELGKIALKEGRGR